MTTLVVKTFGLTYLALAIKDPERAIRVRHRPDRYELEIGYELPTPVDPT